MIEAILKIPDEVLDANLTDTVDETKLSKTRIIIVFLDNEFNITDLDVKTYEQWKNSDKISQKQMRLLNCQRFITPTNVSPSRKGFGGQYGLSTCSPIHLKLSDKYFESLIVKKENKKIISFEQGLVATDFFKPYSTKLIMTLKEFFEKISYNDGKITFKEQDIAVKKNDYILFLIKEQFIDNYSNEYNKFIQSIEEKSKGSTKKGTCIICKETELNNLIVIPFGNFEKENKKHNQLFHKFNNKIHCFPNAYVCINCFSKIDKFFKIVAQRRLFYLPLPLNIRDAGLNSKKLIFDEEKSHKLLEKLKMIYEDNNSEPFDYSLFSCEINNQGINNYRFEYVPNYNYEINKQNRLEQTQLNYHKDKIIIQTKSNSNKSIFLSEINEFFIPKFIVMEPLFVDAKDKKKFKIKNSLIKTKFLQYREQIINFVFKQNSHFINVGLRNL